MLDRPRRGTDIRITVPAGDITGLATVVQRWRAKIRQRKKRQRDAMERVPFTITPNHPALCEALRAFARVSEHERGDKAVAQAVRAILFDADGWEDDTGMLTAVGTAIVDEWVRRWRNQ